jgi:hypothetical protein
MRRSLGIAVFSGMFGLTAFSIFLTPIFYYALQWFGSGTSTGETPHALNLESANGHATVNGEGHASENGNGRDSTALSRGAASDGSQG